MPKTSSHYIVVLVRQARRLGLDVDNILAQCGILPELAETEDQWVDNAYLSSLVKYLWQVTDDETLGFDPVATRTGSWALACDYMLSAENLGELYRKGEHIFDYLPPESMGVSLTVEGTTASVLLSSVPETRDPDHFMMEFWAIIWHRFPSWAIDEHIELQRVFFTYREPGHAWFYEELFQCEVTFDQPSSGYSFSSKYLARPLSRSKTELKVFLHESPADFLYLQGRDTSVTAKIKVELKRELQEHMRFYAFESVCSDLCMSPQVVRRRLAEEGTSYQKIKDIVRCDLVKEMLAQPEIPIGDIAHRAGFTEPAALSRAFKNWTGLTPVQYRENHSPPHSV